MNIKNKVLSLSLLAFLFAAGLLAAEEKEGRVTRKRYDGDDLYLYINTDKNSPGADNIIEINDFDKFFYMPIDEFTNIGSVIRFDDAYGVTLGRYKENPSLSIISVDGINVIDLAEKNANISKYSSIFPYAAKAKQRGN